MIRPSTSQAPYELPPVGDNPSTQRQGTTPGAFANKGRVGTPWTFSSPDTPGMPQPSDKTAWDFLPEGWETRQLEPGVGVDLILAHGSTAAEFTEAAGWTRIVIRPAGFTPITQL